MQAKKELNMSDETIKKLALSKKAYKRYIFSFERLID